MKVVFLDIDGVLRVLNKFSESAVKNLNKLLEEVPELKIVVSSAWRHKGLKYVKDMLEDNGVDSSRIIGITDTKKDSPDRGHHIERWLDKHKEVTKFVILDDKEDMDRVVKELVKTNPYVGLTSSDVKKAIKKLF